MKNEIRNSDFLWERVSAKKQVLWDFNGTLVDDLEVSIEGINFLLRDHHLPEIDEALYKSLFRFPVYDCYVDLGFDFSKESFESLSLRFMDYYNSQRDRCLLFPWVSKTLARVKGPGLHRQLILSALYRPYLVQMVTDYGIRSYFDEIYGLEDILAHSKLELGRRLMANSPLGAEDTLLIGDTDHDLEIGQALGVEVLLVDHGHQCSTRLRSLHHQVLSLVDE